ncbi:5-formyltetrahydrofolate cyclo-ligase [Thalassotalea sp. PLHSN55]|uniref:5-formyltetrahydrofolate cyclo-ligase n=1 Tax=Thalassotalea sp. PLHSN55 TaxID=3435888 RepID=UPI003F846694
MNSRQHLRKQTRAKRQALTLLEQQQASDALLEQLINDALVKKAQSLAIYLANDGELNCETFIKWCWQQGKHVYLPVIHPFSSGNLLFIRYEENTPMVRNRFNIQEPKLNVTKVCLSSQLDIIFTPLVAFDKTGARLGMGGGFYDRTLASWHQKLTQTPEQVTHIKPYPIALAHDCQQVEQIPSAHWDIPLPKIITPSQKITLF